ncbi:MAG: ABC transporter permease [Polyangiaceae bacterium]|nr:ABC transporter permease [Polyangiaceae bacterium]
MIPIKYNIRNLVVRKTTTLASGLGLALVVFVLASALMLSNGIERTLGRAAAEDVAVVLRKGSDTELSSGIGSSQVGMIVANPGVAKDDDGQPLASSELIVVILLDKMGTNGVSNVQVRGVGDNVLRVRKGVRIVEGRPARPGTDEVIVGKAIRGRFKGLELNQTFELRKNRPVTVVGIFDDGGSSSESEVWADLKVAASAFGREGFVSSVRIKLEGESKLDAFKAAVETNPQLEAVVMRETEYAAKQSEMTSLFIKVMGIGIAVLFSIGAMIGAMITMNASIANRQREIATLRALGFQRSSILLSFLLESATLAVAGGLVGAAASLAMRFVRFSTLNFATWSEIVFTFEPTPSIMITSISAAVFMGLVGGFYPAVRAAQMNLVQAIRGG